MEVEVGVTGEETEEREAGAMVSAREPLSTAYSEYSESAYSLSVFHRVDG